MSLLSKTLFVGRLRVTAVCRSSLLQPSVPRQWILAFSTFLFFLSLHLNRSSPRREFAVLITEVRGHQLTKEATTKSACSKEPIRRSSLGQLHRQLD